MISCIYIVETGLKSPQRCLDHKLRLTMHFTFPIFLMHWIVIASSSNLGSKIYFTVNHNKPCVQLANATHQIGCTSAMEGNRGIIHLINFHKDLEWLIEKGPYAPYIPLIDAPMFTNLTMSRLMASKKISGALVILKNSSVTYPFPSSSLPSHSFSPDPSCPLDDFGMYQGNPEYGSCRKVKWNPEGNGMSFDYYGIPIFAVYDYDEIKRIQQCALDHNYNGSSKGYPLCGAELKDFMFAAKDTPTCKRKSELANPIMSTYCDPLGDFNVFGSLTPLAKEIAPESIIMISTRLDSTSFFHDIAPGGDNGITGIVTLLAVARALGDYKRKRFNEKLKPIIFTFFNGEVWDYIGSSRMVWDMENDKFPYSQEGPNIYNGTIDDTTNVQKFNLSHLGFFIELSQLGLDVTGSVFAHSDPISQEEKPIKNYIDKIMAALKAGSKRSGVSFKEVNRQLKNPLPPASFQRFLRKKKIPGVVLADHEKEYANKYYNSRFDNGENLRVGIKTSNLTLDFKQLDGSLPENLTKISEAVAHAIYLLASDRKEPKEKIVVPKNLTSSLLYCLLYSANCQAFSEIGDGTASGPIIDGQTYPRYVSIAEQDNQITHMIYRLLLYYTGEWLDSCPGKSVKLLPKLFSYINVTGSRTNGSLFCVKGTVYMTEALSPAFELKDYASTEYSTWTESMWNSDIGIRIFLVADPQIEGIILVSGIIIFICSFGLTFFFRRKATILFTPTPTPVMAISG